MNPLKLILFLAVFFFSVDAGMAQTSKKELRKQERAEKKRLKKEAREEKQEQLWEMVKDQSFVVEASTLFGRRMMTPYEVSPTTNFIKIEGNRVVLQTANNFSLGYNGLGGITINGNISSYKVIDKNKNSLSVLIRFSDPLFGASTLNLKIQENGFARARIVDNWGGGAIFQGRVFSPENSRVFQGRSII